MLGMNERGTLTEAASRKIRNMGILCAFLVVIIHCRPHFGRGTTGWWLEEILENGVTQIAVPFFFTVSGYMVGRSLQGKGYRKAVGKRVRTLLVPFVLWNALFWLENFLWKNAHSLLHGRTVSFTFPTLRQIGLWPTRCPYLTPLWYVRALFILVVLSPAFVWCLKKFRGWFLLLLFVVYAAVCPFWPLPNAGQWEEFARVGIFPVLGLFFFFARPCATERNRGFQPPPPVVSLTVGIGLAVFRAFFVLKGLPAAEHLGFLCVPFTLYGVWGLMGDSRWPEWLVSSSFGVYLVHKFVLLPVKAYLHPGRSTVAYLGVAVFAFAVSLAIAELLKRTMPKTSAVLFGGR